MQELCNFSYAQGCNKPCSKECWLGPWYHLVFFTKQGTSHCTWHRLEGTRGTTGTSCTMFCHGHLCILCNLLGKQVQPALWACQSLLAEQFV
jgi:hypothetical protein